MEFKAHFGLSYSLSVSFYFTLSIGTILVTSITYLSSFVARFHNDCLQNFAVTTFVSL